MIRPRFFHKPRPAVVALKAQGTPRRTSQHSALVTVLDAARQTEVRAQTEASDPRNGLAIGPGVLNDPFFGEVDR
jgi:hypothetical protein